MHKILIVDDRRDIARALAIRLNALGYGTCLAYDAASALDVALRQAPSLILMDICMPDGGGLSVAEQVRAHPAAAAIPVVFMTASKDPQIRDRAMALKPAGYFEKPFNSSALAIHLAEILGATGAPEGAAG
jgi:CheY-like chemotaxis protein